jgi:hypothetical protein
VCNLQLCAVLFSRVRWLLPILSFRHDLTTATRAPPTPFPLLPSLPPASSPAHLPCHLLQRILGQVCPPDSQDAHVAVDSRH